MYYYFFLVENFTTWFTTVYKEYVIFKNSPVLFIDDFDLRNAEYYQRQQVHWQVNDSSAMCDYIDVIFGDVTLDTVDYVEQSAESQRDQAIQQIRFHLAHLVDHVELR